MAALVDDRRTDVNKPDKFVSHRRPRRDRCQARRWWVGGSMTGTRVLASWVCVPV